MAAIKKKYMKKYNIILADPPWKYRDKCTAGKRGASFKYPVLSVEDIMKLNVQNIAAENCALFLWATAPMIRESISVVKAWGFNFKTIAFTWIKTNKKASTLFWGMGNYTRSNPEYCLLGIKGKLERKSASVHSVIESKIGTHSRKPVEIYNRISKLYGNLPSVELFAVNPIIGWESYGYEINGLDIFKILNK